MNLETSIQQYQPSVATIELVRQTPIVFLAGIAGAGKGTVAAHLLESGRFRQITSHTTRAPRINNGAMEQEGREYHFVDQSTVESMIENHEFVEVKFVHDTVYGTSAAELKAANDEAKIALTDIDVQGIAEYKKISPDVVAIFVLPPSPDVWLRRLENRYNTSEAFVAEWSKRRASAIKELQHVLETPYYHFLVNDDITRAVAAAKSITDAPDLETDKNIAMREHAKKLLAAIEATH